MTSNENNWTLGEVANLPRMDKMLKDGTTAYMQFIASRYICIREATDGQRGILVKVLGKSYSDQIKTIDGKPFGFDDRAELFSCDSFYSYPFPSANEVHEVLDILRGMLLFCRSSKMPRCTSIQTASSGYARLPATLS